MISQREGLVANRWRTRMSVHENFEDQTFLVTDPDARLRDPDDIWQFLKYRQGDALPLGATVGDFKLIPKNTLVRVKAVRIEPTGASHKFFADVAAADGSTDYGWTSTANFEGGFRNVTLGKISPKPDAGQFADTAAWSKGSFIGQVTLVLIVDNRLELEKLTEAMAGPYFDMVTEAGKAGVTIAINSGFRTFAAQKHLFDNFKAGVPGFNLAAKPGSSNHQNGTALDIPVGGGPGNPVYDWLAAHATGFGFIRTVKSELWHWEFRPGDAGSARQRGVHTLWD